MSEFEEELKQARDKQLSLYSKLSLFAGVIGIILAGFFLYTSAISIKVLPSEISSLSTLSIKSGTGFSLGSKIIKLSDAISVQVEAPGYQKKIIDLGESKNNRVITVTLLPQPSGVNFSVSSNFPDVKWILSDDVVAVGNKFQSDLEPGEYQLKIESKFFKPLQFDFSLGVGKVVEKTFEVERSMFELIVQLENGPGEIIINGKSYKDTEVAKTTLFSGQYEVLVNKKSYKSYQEKINLPYGKDSLVKTIRLSKDNVTVQFDVFPKGGVFIFGGKKSDPGKSFSLSPDKEYVVSYEKKGFARKSVRFFPRDYVGKKVTVNLEGAQGTVVLNSTPGSNVYINKKNMGNTPLTIELPVISHEVVLRKKGYVDEKFSVKPEKDQKVYIEKTLVSVLEQKRAQQKKRYSVSSIAMAMRLFKPRGDIVILGAPRNEVGQRANEFLRSVKMSRAFYVAEHEVTEKQYQQIVGKGKSSNIPVTNVTWIEAVRFCNELSKREGLKPYYTIRGNGVVFSRNSDGYRLPSESEWEWVSRKFKKRAPTIYSWGNRNKIPSEAGNIADESAKGITKGYVARYNDSHAEIAPVKSFSAEKNGLFDMFGNVSEWVGDYYSLNPYDSKKIYEDLVNSRPSKSNVIKGASWKSSSVTELRASYREGLIGKREDVGFRIARNAE
ncbi:MAG: hypothetical protein CBC42_04430 [Betaproteobacteria bacterium TMED82]|nr:MAG: hypothetical protein CBC42_04430 [Betaproteobacteria bacterium TMED82]